MKARIRKLFNDEYVMEIKTIFGWQGIAKDGCLQKPKMAFFADNPCWPQCFCKTAEEAKGRIVSYLSWS